MTHSVNESINELINYDGGDCRTAPATPGLLIKYTSLEIQDYIKPEPHLNFLREKN